jgi:hypothetical protein
MKILHLDHNHLIPSHMALSYIFIYFIVGIVYFLVNYHPNLILFHLICCFKEGLDSRISWADLNLDLG